MLSFIGTTVFASEDHYYNINDLFIQAISKIEINPNYSIEALNYIYKQTGEPRVLLELGRAQFNAGKYEDSKNTFISALSLNLPFEVRRKVEFFISQIRKKSTQINLTFGIISDSNPSSNSETQIIYINNLPFIYSPDITPERNSGTMLGVNIKSPKTSEHPIKLEIDLSRKTFNKSIHNQNIYSLLAYTDTALKSPIKLGIYINGLEHNNFDNNISKGLFGSLGINLNTSSFLELTKRIGKSKYSESKPLNTKDSTISTRYIYNIPQYHAKFQAQASLQKNKTKINILDRSVSTFGFSIFKAVPSLNISYIATYSNSTFKFDRVDPIFLLVRKDKVDSLAVNIKKENLYIFGAKPIIQIGKEKRSSNIPIANYNRTFFGLFFENIY